MEAKPRDELLPGRRRRFDAHAAEDSARSRGETLDQLLDRNLMELLQELRVAITGVQVLFAFLLGLAFTQRFAALSGVQLAIYALTLLSTALAAIVLIAPVAFHRLIFRRRQKAALVAVTDRLLLVGLGLLLVAISSGVLLILDVALGRWAGVAGCALIATVGAGTWYALPLAVRRPRPAPAGPPATDRRLRPASGGHRACDADVRREEPS